MYRWQDLTEHERESIRQQSDFEDWELIFGQYERERVDGTDCVYLIEPRETH